MNRAEWKQKSLELNGRISALELELKNAKEANFGSGAEELAEDLKYIRGQLAKVRPLIKRFGECAKRPGGMPDYCDGHQTRNPCPVLEIRKLLDETLGKEVGNG